MGVQTKTVTTYECDFCGRSYDDEYAHGESAHVTLQVSGRAYNGDVGGATHKEWWCGLCLMALRGFTAKQRERYGNA